MEYSLLRRIRTTYRYGHSLPADRMHPNKASFVPAVCGSGLSDKSSSDSAADVSPLSKKTGGEAARILLLERMLPTRLSSLV